MCATRSSLPSRCTPHANATRTHHSPRTPVPIVLTVYANWVWPPRFPHETGEDKTEAHVAAGVMDVGGQSCGAIQCNASVLAISGLARLQMKLRKMLAESWRQCGQHSHKARTMPMCVAGNASMCLTTYLTARFVVAGHGKAAGRKGGLRDWVRSRV